MPDKTDEGLELETLEVETRLVGAEIEAVKLSLEQIASRERAHQIKVAKFLSGGDF